MPLDITTITGLRAAPDEAGDLVLTWANSSPGSPVQIYVDGSLAWRGFSSVATIPMPSGPATIDVGTVGPTEVLTSFASSLPTPPGGGGFASLSWLGGTYLDGARGDVAGFRVHGSAVPGGPVVGTTVLGEIPAYVGDILDGFGLGGFGQGGWGMAASQYVWTSARLSPGTWSFRVDSLDSAGNESAGATTTAVIAGPPREPASFSDGARLHLTFGATTYAATLTWNAPPA